MKKLRGLILFLALANLVGAVVLGMTAWKIGYTNHVASYSEYRQLYNAKAIVVDNAIVRQVSRDWELEGWGFSLDNWDTVHNIIERHVLAWGPIWELTLALLCVQAIVLAIAWWLSGRITVASAAPRPAANPSGG